MLFVPMDAHLSEKGTEVRQNRYLGIVTMGLLALAAGQGGCIFSWIPHYEPGFDCTIEFRDAETGRLIERDVVMLEYSGQSSWTDVSIIGSASHARAKTTSADLSTVRTGSSLSQWGRCIFKIPTDVFGLSVKRRFHLWRAEFFTEGYISGGTSAHTLVTESDEHDGRVTIEMLPDSNPLAAVMLSEDVEALLPGLLRLVPESGSRRELLLLLERQAVRILEATEKRPPASRQVRNVDLPCLRDTTLPRIRQALAEEPG